MDSDEGKLFVGGIAWDTTEDTLRDHFNQYGEVSQVVINAWRRKRALSREEQHTSSRTGSFNGGRGSGGAGDFRTKKIFVGGLPSTVTEDVFPSIFFKVMVIVNDVVVMYDQQTQRPRGFGFITFDSEDAVDNVLQKTFHELNGKLVELMVESMETGIYAAPNFCSGYPPYSGYAAHGLWLWSSKQWSWYYGSYVLVVMVVEMLVMAMGLHSPGVLLVAGGSASAPMGQYPAGASGYGNQGYGYGNYGGSDGPYSGGYGATGGRAGNAQMQCQQWSWWGEATGSGSYYGDSNGNSGYANEAWRSDPSQASGGYGGAHSR
uniref:RRM domain-containing protein n=1 Tax=Populus alba TaxID=43335 RepID=A0A4U5QN27_POPAL|nr:hypothetical protein D5086_0000067640 [Populus alba]